MQTLHDLCCTSSRKICSSHRTIKNSIATKQYRLIFQRITAASLGMSRWMNHLNRKTSNLNHVQIFKKNIRRNGTISSTMCCHINLRFPKHLFFLTTGINRNIVFLFHCLSCHDMVKMSMCKQNCHRFSIHLRNFQLNLLRTVCRIYNDQLSGFFIFKEIAVCIYRS